MPTRVSYGQLRSVLTELGFRETRQERGVALKHRKSDTMFVFRPYEEDDRVTPAELLHVRKLLDEKGLLEPESFEALLTKAPA